LPSWLAVAKNEYRLMLSGRVTRRLRRILPVMLVSLVVVIAVALPLVSRFLFLELRVREYLEDMLTLPLRPDPVLSLFIVDTSIVLRMGAISGTLAFVIPILVAIGRQLEEVEVVSKDVVLSSPLKPVHVIIGEFMVNLIMLPVILLVSTIMLVPVALTFYLTFQAVALILTAITLACLTGIWVAVIASTYLFTREPTGKIKSALKALLGALGVSMGIGILFLSMSVTPPNLWFLPSLWVASIIHFAATQSNITIIKIGFTYLLMPVQPDGWTSFILLASLFVLSFLMGAVCLSKVNFTGIEKKEEALIVKKENFFYRAIRRSLPSPLSVVTVSQLKEFTRRTDNIARFLSVIMFPVIVLLMSKMMQFDFTKVGETLVSLASLSGFYFVLAGVILPMMIIPYIFIDTKDILWTIKKTPRGVKLLVYSMLAETIILCVPMSIVMALLFYLAMWSIGGNPAVFLAVMLFMVFVSTAIATGVYASRPVFKEKGLGHFVNFVITLIATGLVVSATFILLVIPWIPNLLVAEPLIKAASWLPQPTSTLVSQAVAFLLINAAPKDPFIQIAGAVASFMLGVVVAYTSIKRGTRKLELYEG